MRTLISALAILTLGILAVGCQQPEQKVDAGKTPQASAVPPKPGATDQAQVKTMEPGLTDAGKGADSRIGSKSGGN